MCVSMKLKVLWSRMKLKIARTIWEGGQFVGRRNLYFSMNWMTADMPSSCGMGRVGT